MTHNLNTIEIELIRKHIADVNDLTVLDISDWQVDNYISDSTAEEVADFIECLNERFF